jgi:hypothetical protein
MGRAVEVTTAELSVPGDNEIVGVNHRDQPKPMTGNDDHEKEYL